MQRIWIPKTGTPNVLEVREEPDPTPGPGEVRIAVAAAGINFADLMARMGLYPDAPPLPAVVGYEVSGRIDAVGDGVDASRIGQAVVGMCRFGGYSSSIVLGSSQAVPLPEGADLELAASIPVTALTAWMMLEEMGRVRAGDRVLVHSAGGGVGLAALDLLLWRGATAVGTASQGKHAFLTERGYHQLVDYRTDDYAEVLADGPGFDLILDPLGGANWGKGLSLLRPGGRLVCFGMSVNAQQSKRSLLSVVKNMAAVPWLSVNPISLMNDNKGVMGVNMGHMWDESDRVVSWLHQLLDLWTAGTLRPHVHASFPFSQAAEAHQLIHDRENFGKVLLTPDP
jgi:NADPH:quinone reductase-like Zn-dependent oxidoreductase